jgi:hypothetical protein
LAAFEQLAVSNNIPIDASIVDKLENMCALYAILREAVTTTQLCGALFLYFKTLYGKSVALEAANYLSMICELQFDTQSGEFTEERKKEVIGALSNRNKTIYSAKLTDSERPKWLRLLKDCQENWTLVIRNEGFEKISRILSLALALGLCEASSLDFKVAGMKLFSVGAAARHASCVDLVDAICDTVVYFAEGGYACFLRGSLKPLLYGNRENEQFEQDYGLCQQCFDFAKAGNLGMLKLDENDYEQLLCETIDRCTALANSCRGAVEKNVLRRKLDALRNWQSSFRQTRVQGGLRTAPYSIGVFGGTGVGKSSVANIMMVTTLLHNGYQATDDRIVTLNETDKFWSNYRSYVNGVFIDDLGNTKAEFVERAPTSLMIQLVNNVRTYATVAEAEMKGKVSVEPKVVISTKNVKDSCATIYSNEPASIARRDRITLTVRVRPEFATHGMLDQEKVERFYGRNQIPVIPDLWEITVEKAVPVPNKVKGRPDMVGWIPVEWGGIPLVDVSIHKLIRFVAEDSKAFYERQEELVANQNNIASKLSLCERCGLVRDVCVCDVDHNTYIPRAERSCPVVGYCTNCGAHHDESHLDYHETESNAPSDEESEDPYAETGLPLDWEDTMLTPEEAQRDIDEYRRGQTYDVQFGTAIATVIVQRLWKWERIVSPKLEYWTESLESKTVDWMLKRLEWLETSPYTAWTNYVPSDWLSSELFKNIVWFTESDTLKNRIRRSYMNHCLLILFWIAATFFVTPWCFFLIVFQLLCVTRVVEAEKRLLYVQVAADNQAMPKIFKMYRDRHVKWITGICIAIACAYAVANIWKKTKCVPTPQGNLAPTQDKEIEERDAEVNPWAGVVVEPMPCLEDVKSVTVDQLENMVKKNLTYMEMRVPNSTKVYYCNAFFMCSNVAVIPNHMWIAEDMKCKFIRHDPTKIGGNFEAYINRTQSVRIPGTDMCLVWVPNGGDWKDLSRYLPLTRFTSAPARFIFKAEEGEIVKQNGKPPRVKMVCGPVSSAAGDYYGAEYALPFKSFPGLCMAPLVTETRGPTIGGFHLAGRNGRPFGASGLLLKGQFDDALNELRECPGVVLAKSSGVIPTQLYGVQFYQGDDVHPKSAVNFLEHGSNIKYYGQVTGRATYHSEVETSVISKEVEEVMGVPQKWGPPKFRTGYPFQASLVYSAKPSCGIEGSLLIRAAEDYKRDIIKCIRRFPSLKKDIRPLSEMETVCGIDGKRFFDKMPPNTSVGFPLSGAKSKFLTLLDPADHPTHQCPAELDPMFWKEAYRMEELYVQGQRAYPIFKACLKDEPTKLDKDKVRVFQGAPMALQLLVRKYFLPVARSLSMIPLVSECAVGVNSSGPEWDQLAKHMRKFGLDRILAGDYSKYDLRMSAQLMFAAFRILIDIARSEGEYSERDILVMEGIATDICYPLMAYNGDLIQHFGSNPSGQNLTVYINSIVNSLLMRCAFFEIVQPKSKVRFRDACSLMTYGDDVKSSVKKGYDQFNHISVAEFLSARDMKFTMPDKESTPTPYMDDADADFLKRKNIENPELGLTLGGLDPDSNFKSLHANLRSKAVTKEQQAMQNIDGFLREAFPFGREYYEDRRAELRVVAEKKDLSHGCNMLDVTYDECISRFKEKYE